MRSDPRSAAVQALIALLLSPMPAAAATLALGLTVILTPGDSAAADAAADSVSGATPPGTAPTLAPADPVHRIAAVDALARTSSAGAATALATMRPPTRKLLSPGAALGVGIGCSVAPVVIAALLDPPGSHSTFAWEAALTIGAAVGVVVGPSMGLRSGGREDLARRGLILRGLCAATAVAGAVAVGVAMGSEEGGTGTATLAILGAVGGLVCVGSWLRDLAITPSATTPGRPHRAQLGVRPDGRLALSVRF
jgi:hypothetical protein